MSNNIKHILVIRSSAMGDVAMTIPVLLAFREAYPSIKITVLTKAFFAPFFHQIPNLEIKVFETETSHKGVWGIQKLAKELKAEGIDAIADLHNVLRSNILKNLLRFSGIPFVQINKGRSEKKALTHWENKVFKPLKTTHDRYASVFRNLNFNFEFSNQKFVLEKENLNEKIQNLTGYSTQKWIGFAPFAKHKAKTYSIEQLAKVISTLDKTNDYKIILFGGGKEEAAKLSEIANPLSNVISVAEVLNMSEELQLISNLDLMVSMDSSNGHLAAMYGIPVITIWGVTHPYAGFTPYKQPINNSLLPDMKTYPKIPTSIYGNKFPEGYDQAINSIAPLTVLNKITNLLS